MPRIRSGKKVKGSPGYEGIPTGDMRLVADVLGPDAARLLMLRLPKTPLYVPQPEEFKLWYIRTHFTGENVVDLANDLGLSHATVYRYIKKMYAVKVVDDSPRQMALL